MKKLAALALGTALVAPVAALAGNLTTPVAEPVVAAPPVVAVSVTPDWTGWYAGGSLGYGNVNSDGPADGSGVIGGLLGGYRYDFGQWVLGVEADYDWANIGLNDAGTSSLDAIYRFKVQAGADLGQTFVYGTGGIARAEGKVDNADRSSNGWVAGVGADYAVNSQWLVGGEILYHQFDDFARTGVDGDATTFKIRAAYRF